MKKKILVACGAGVCTSTVALQKLQAKLEEEGLKDQVTYGQCSVADLPMNAGSYDVVVTTSRVQGNYGTPVVFGLSLHRSAWMTVWMRSWTFWGCDHGYQSCISGCGLQQPR